MKKFLSSLVIIISLLCMSSFASANSNYGSGNYGSCQYGGCSITVSSNSSVSIDVTPTASGKCTIQSDTVAVLTDNTDGYLLTVNTSGTNTSLVSGGNSITATTGTQASPIALANDTWGYRVDNIGGFGAGPTSSQSNISPPSTKFAGVPASNVTSDTIANTSSPSDPATNTTVWYGACIDTSVPNGTYTRDVIYTATTN